MANKGLQDLLALDVSSVTDANSLFLFIGQQGNTRYISASALQRSLGFGCVFCVAQSQNVQTNSGDYVNWDLATIDTNSMWNGSSEAVINFEGYIRCGFNASDGTTSADKKYMEIWKNDAIYDTNHQQAGGITGGVAAAGQVFHVMTVTSGDTIGFKCHRENTAVCSLEEFHAKAWIEVLQYVTPPGNLD